MNAFSLVRELKLPSQQMSGLTALKTRYRPLICPLDLVLDQIPWGTRLYDIGCGTGTLLYLALKLKSVAIAHGYDISPDVVAASHVFPAYTDEPHRFQVVYKHPTETPPSLSGYDTVTMIDVLHHIPLEKQDDFIRKIVANMNPGAKLIIKDIEASKVIGAFLNQIHDLLLAREWVHQRRSQDVIKVLQSTGVTVNQIFLRWTLWYPHFQIVAVIPSSNKANIRNI